VYPSFPEELSLPTTQFLLFLSADTVFLVAVYRVFILRRLPLPWGGMEIQGRIRSGLDNTQQLFRMDDSRGVPV